MWDTNLTIEGILNFTLHMYHNSSINSTIKIGRTHKTRPRNILFELVPGKNQIIVRTKLMYAQTHISVGTGHLTHFKSAPGLSKILNFLNKYRQTKNTAIMKKIENK